MAAILDAAEPASRPNTTRCVVFSGENDAVRADRLVSLVLLLRHRGRMTAGQLAAELEVSERTVLRDIGALSTAGVPVYADRGRHGGFSLLPGFRTELTSLTAPEALALLSAGSDSARSLFGLDAALTSAMRKVVDALPEGSRLGLDEATRRLLVEPEEDLLSRRLHTENLADGVMREVRSAVLTGHRLRIEYAAPGTSPSERLIDPIGLVVVRGHTYLLATRDGHDRTYRLSRMMSAEELTEPAERPEQVDLDRLWAERSAQFLAEDHLAVGVRVRRARRDGLLDTVRSVRAESEENDGWIRLEVSFEDLRHAVWAIWQLGTEIEVLEPESLRTALYERAATLARRYES